MTGRWSGSPELGPLAFDSIEPPTSFESRPVAFLDRDGVLNEAVPDPVSGELESPLLVEDVRLLPGAALAVARLASAGYVIACVSNQPAAAKGKVTIQRLQAVHERVVELLANEDVSLDTTRLCLHHPAGLAPGLSRPCDCRKPAAGMLIDAADALATDLSASWMLGDTGTDVEAGRAAGCRTVLIEYAGSSHKRQGAISTADLLATDLADGVAQLLDHNAG